MNLRVDLILDTERRSGRIVTARRLIRAVSIVVPSALALLVALALLRLNALSSKVHRMENEWRVKAPQKEQAIGLKSHTAENLARVEEIEMWKTSRVDISDLLRALPKEVSADMQLTELRFTEEIRLVEKQGALRMNTLTVSGKSDGPKAKVNVEQLTARLQSAPPFTNVLAKASVPPGAFAADPASGATGTRRIFQIHAESHARPFEKACKTR